MGSLWESRPAAGRLAERMTQVLVNLPAGPLSHRRTYRRTVSRERFFDLGPTAAGPRPRFAGKACGGMTQTPARSQSGGERAAFFPTRLSELNNVP